MRVAGIAAGVWLVGCAGARVPGDGEERAYREVQGLTEARLVGDGRALIDACDRFVIAYPDSPHAPAVAYVAAQAYYQRGANAPAVTRFLALALAPEPNKEYCAAAANFVLDAYTEQGDLEAMDTFLRRYQASPCEALQRPVAEPIATAPVGGPALDDLAFLSGCWRHWAVDWGFTLCWRREDGAWVGSAESYGATEPGELVLLQISTGAKGPVLTSGEKKGWWLWSDLTDAEVVARTGTSVAFAAGSGQLELSRDAKAGTLLLKRGGTEYRLRPQKVTR